METKNCEDGKTGLNLRKFIYKYPVFILILVSVPFILSLCCYFSLPYFNEAGPSAWLGFWGGYLGSSIMAAITLYVLDRQLEQNHRENEDNRFVNDKNNEYNRQLQFKLFIYQQKRSHLLGITTIFEKIINLFENNVYLDFCAELSKHRNETLENKIRSTTYLINRINHLRLEIDYLYINLYHPLDKDSKQLINELNLLFDRQRNMINDIKIILELFKSEDINNVTLPESKKITRIMNEILEDNLNEVELDFSKRVLKAIGLRIIKENDCKKKVRRIFLNYLTNENKKIEELMKYGTDNK